LYAKNATYKKGHHGNGILCKYPIISWHNENLSKTKYASRSYLHAKILLPNDIKLNLVCVHLGLFEAERELQLTQIAQIIEETIPDDEPLIMAGDFNDLRKRALDHMKILKKHFIILQDNMLEHFPFGGQPCKWIGFIIEDYTSKRPYLFVTNTGKNYRITFPLGRFLNFR